MATIDEINLLDYQAPTPEQILKAGRKPVAEPIEGSTLPFDIAPVPPSFNPAKDFFYNKILTPQGRNLFDTTSTVGKAALDPLNFAGGVGGISKADKLRRGIASIGHNKGPSLDNLQGGTVVSDDVARKIFDVDKEMDDLYDLRKRKKRVDDQYVFNEKLTDKDRELLDIEADALEKAIKNLEYKTMDKIEKRFETNIASRTIDELDPKILDRPSMGKVTSLAVGEKNRDILKNVEASIDSPGMDTYDKSTYGGRKFRTQLHTLFRGSDKDIDDPDYLYNYTKMMVEGSPTKVNKKGIASLNPLEIYEKSLSPPVTMQIGVNYGKPIEGQTLFFVDPKKLADKLDKSGAGEDFFKLRKDEVDYLDKLEESIMTKGYQINPVQISIYPSGNANIFEGNHRLYRALARGDKEVPVTFQYLGGAERLDTPFGINELDSFVATGEKGYKKGKELAKYIKDVEKTYKPASTNIVIKQGISNRQQQVTKLKRELELEGGDMLPKTKRQQEKKIVKLMKEIDDMSK
jgi:hypothetical protein